MNLQPRCGNRVGQKYRKTGPNQFGYDFSSKDQFKGSETLVHRTFISCVKNIYIHKLLIFRLGPKIFHDPTQLPKPIPNSFVVFNFQTYALNPIHRLSSNQRNAKAHNSTYELRLVTSTLILSSTTMTRYGFLSYLYKISFFFIISNPTKGTFSVRPLFSSSSLIVSVPCFIVFISIS